MTHFSSSTSTNASLPNLAALQIGMPGEKKRLKIMTDDKPLKTETEETSLGGLIGFIDAQLVETDHTNVTEVADLPPLFRPTANTPPFKAWSHIHIRQIPLTDDKNLTWLLCKFIQRVAQSAQDRIITYEDGTVEPLYAYLTIDLPEEKDRRQPYEKLGSERPFDTWRVTLTTLMEILYQRTLDEDNKLELGDKDPLRGSRREVVFAPSVLDQYLKSLPAWDREGGKKFAAHFKNTTALTRWNEPFRSMTNLLLNTEDRKRVIRDRVLEQRRRLQLRDSAKPKPSSALGPLVYFGTGIGAQEKPYIGRVTSISNKYIDVVLVGTIDITKAGDKLLDQYQSQSEDSTPLMNALKQIKKNWNFQTKNNQTQLLVNKEGSVWDWISSETPLAQDWSKNYTVPVLNVLEWYISPEDPDLPEIATIDQLLHMKNARVLDTYEETLHLIESTQTLEQTESSRDAFYYIATSLILKGS
jgi:hypothetical protein